MKKIATLIIIQIMFATNFVYSQGEMIIKEEKTNLRGKHIRDLSEDGNGNIWLLTSLGGAQADQAHLCQYTTNGEWYNFKDNKEIYGHKFYSLESEKNNIMSCYHKNGVYVFDGSSWKNYTEETILKEFNIPRKEKIHRFHRDDQNRTWVETSKGLLLCENNNYKRYLEDIDFKDKWTFFSDGHVYSASGVYQFIDDEFFKINEKDYENLRFKGTDTQNRNWYTKVDREKGDLYFTISYYINNTWKDFNFELPYGSNPLISPKLHFQPDSTVWVCSGEFIGYIKDDVLKEYLLDGLVIQDYLKENKIARSIKTNINDMQIDSKKNIWLTTGDPGKALIIKILPDEDIEIFESESKLPISYFSDIFEDSHKRIWIGTTLNGIFMYQYNDN